VAIRAYPGINSTRGRARITRSGVSFITGIYMLATAQASQARTATRSGKGRFTINEKYRV
jgi:hypothetical protein